jgi:hypothetical protein
MTDKKPGSSNRTIVYKCYVCQQEKPRADLLAKRTTFSTIRPVKLVRSRVIGWECSGCRAVDPTWTSEPFKNSPGMADTKLADS